MIHTELYLGMKTAISIPDELFQSADDLAKELGTTRSGLYAQAVAEYVAKHRQADVTAQLNKVHGKAPSKLPVDIRRSQTRVLESVDW